VTAVSQSSVLRRSFIDNERKPTFLTAPSSLWFLFIIILFSINLRQLTKLPANPGRKFSRACVDSPSDADTFQTMLRDGDVVVAYVRRFFLQCFEILRLIRPLVQTDGFSDNVFPNEMTTICRLAARSGGTEDEIAQAMADRMVEYSLQCMRSKTRVSPFESTHLTRIQLVATSYIP
jgi:hypothetical protein